MQTRAPILILSGLLIAATAHAQRYDRTPIDGTTAEAGFGRSIAAGDVDGDGYQDMLAAEEPGGPVRLFLGGAGFPGGLRQDTDASLTFTDPGLAERAERFGSAIAVGDINDDGYDDVVIGSEGYEAGPTPPPGFRVGAAYVYCGGPTVDTAPDFVLRARPHLGEGGADNTYVLGGTVAVGDVNGDGTNDVVAGAYSVGVGRQEAYAFTGSSAYCSGDLETLRAEADAAQRIEGVQDFGGVAGERAVVVADVNRDGFDDVFVAAADGLPAFLGSRAGLFYGSRSLRSVRDGARPDLTILFENLPGEDGEVISRITHVAAGDLTGDGYADLALATEADDGTDVEHRIYVHSGFALAAAAPGTVEADDTPRMLRHHAASLAIGQIDNRGPQDLLVGAPDEHGGAAFVYHGASDFVRPILGIPPPIVLLSDTRGEGFGASVAVLGATNPGPSIELAVGAPTNSARGPGAGRAYVFTPGFELIIPDPDLSLDPCERYWADTPYGFQFCDPRFIELDPERLSLEGLFAPDSEDPDDPEAFEDVTQRFEVELFEGEPAHEACLDPSQPCLRLTLREGAEPVRNAYLRLAAKDPDEEGVAVGVSYFNGLGQAISVGTRRVLRADGTGTVPCAQAAPDLVPLGFATTGDEYADFENVGSQTIDLASCAFASWDPFTETVRTSRNLSGTLAPGAVLRVGEGGAAAVDVGSDPLFDGPGAFSLHGADASAIPPGSDVGPTVPSVVASLVYLQDGTAYERYPRENASKASGDLATLLAAAAAGAVEAPSYVVALADAYPSPFNPAAIIRFTLPADGLARLAVYDLLGRPVAVLVDGPLAAGAHAVRFDGSALASGTYLYRLEAGGRVLTRRMTLMK